MKRVAPLFVGMMILIPALTLAQTRPVPPPPPPPPAPVTPPVPPAPPAPPMPVMSHYDRMAVDDARHAAEAVRIDSERIREEAHFAAEQARVAMADARFNNDFRFNWDQQGVGNSYVTYSGQSNESSSYNNALSLMNEKRYEEAVSRFDRVIMQKGAHADAAMYHKAYCQARLGQSNEAVATLAELRKSYPQSAYLKDARAIEADVRQLGPSQVDDEDLKLIAIQSLQNQSPDQAIPLLEGVLAKSTNSLRYKGRALFVLAQIDSPRARQILLSYAKGAGNPDLQKKAIEYLGSRGQKTTSAELIEIYNSTTDYDIRSAVIGAFRAAGAKSPLMNIATSGSVNGQVTAATVANMQQNTQLRSRAIQGLTDLASPQELWPLYQKEENKDLRAQWVSTFTQMGAVDQLLEIAKTEKEPAVKNRAIRNLGNFKADKTGTALTEAYTGGEKDTKIAVIGALGNQNNAEGLIAVYNKETDLSLRKEVLNRLFDMSKSNKAALDFLMTIIK